MNATKIKYKVSNEFHGFSKYTRSEKQVARLVRSSKPADCYSRTLIFRIENGVVVGRMDYDGKTLRDLFSL